MASKRGVHDDAGPGLTLGLIITPFLDFAFQLLAFFIMTYNPSALEGHIDGTLAASAPAIQGDPAVDPIDFLTGEPELVEAVVVRVKAVGPNQVERDRFEGQPSRIEIKRIEDAQPTLVADATVTLDEGLSQLEAELRSLATPPGGNASIRLEGDRDLKHRYLMRVYDACRAAGYQNISFVAPMRRAD